MSFSFAASECLYPYHSLSLSEHMRAAKPLAFFFFGSGCRMQQHRKRHVRIRKAIITQWEGHQGNTTTTEASAHTLGAATTTGVFLASALASALTSDAGALGGSSAFFGAPSPELLARWYQAAAFLPFYRGHAHLDAPRREPWTLPPPFAAVAIEAIRERQRLMPYWATLWFRAAHSEEDEGRPLVAPPWVLFPSAPQAPSQEAGPTPMMSAYVCERVGERVSAQVSK